MDILGGDKTQTATMIRNAFQWEMDELSGYSLNHPRVHSAVTFLNETLYVMGSANQSSMTSMDYLNPSMSIWTLISAKMNAAR